MKKIIILVFMMFILSLVSFAQSNDALNARISAINFAGEKHYEHMQGVIEIAKENNLSIVELDKYSLEFLSELQKVKLSSNLTSANNFKDSLSTIAKNFRDSARDLNMISYENKIKEKIQNRLNISKERLDNFEKKFKESRSSAILNVYDNHIKQAQNIIDKEKIKELDVTELENKLLEIKNSKNNMQLLLTKLELNDSIIKEESEKTRILWQEFKDLVHINLKGQLMNKIAQNAEKVEVRVNDKINMVKEKGFNVTNAENAISNYSEKLDDAKELIESKNYFEAKEKLTEAKQQLIQVNLKVRDSIKNKNSEIKEQRKMQNEGDLE